MTGKSSRIGVLHREHLWPNRFGWATAVGAGFVTALALLPADGRLALVVGAAVLVLALAVAVVTTPVVKVRAGELRAGRAHIPVSLLGGGVPVSPEARRDALGRDLDPRAFVCLRAWIPAMVRWDVLDRHDPTPYWIVSTRRPEDLAAAVSRAQEKP